VQNENQCDGTDPCHEARVVQSPDDLSEFIFGGPHRVGVGLAGSPDPMEVPDDEEWKPARTSSQPRATHRLRPPPPGVDTSRGLGIDSVLV
jgi:hypothetical protein